MSTPGTLKAAQALLHNETRWCQRAFAKNSAGGIVSATDPYARSWCASGAVFHVTRTDEDHAWDLAEAFDCLARAATPDELCDDVDDMIGAIAAVNDYAAKNDTNKRNAFKKVHQMYDRAIALAEAA